MKSRITKLAVAALVLMLAVLIPSILTVAWDWYMIIWIVLAIRPLIRFFKS